MAHHLLSNVLSNLRRRMLWIGGVSGVGWGLAAGLLCLLLGVWMDLVLEFSPALRISTLVLSSVAIVVFAMAVLWKTKQSSGLQSMAKRLDTVAETGGQIDSGLSLSMMKGDYIFSQSSKLTSGMAELAVGRAAELAEKVDQSKAVPTDPLKRSAYAFFGLIAVPLLFVLLLPRLAATEWNRFTNPFGDNPPFSNVIFHVDPEGAKVVYGDGIDIHVTVEGDAVEDLELVLEATSKDGDHRSKASPSDVLPMFPEQENRWRATISDIKTPLEYYVRARNARSRRFKIEVITVPKIVETRFRVIPPEYTRQPVYEGPLPKGGLSGLPGTRVEIVTKSNRPLSGGRLTFLAKGERQETALVPIQEGANEVAGSFEILKSGRIAVKVVDEDGQESRETLTALVTVLADERPFVRLLQPRAVSFATPTALIPVEISAEDDYGISRVQLFRNLNDSRYLPMDVDVIVPSENRFHAVVPLPLAVYGLVPGDEIKLFARVEDNDPTTDNRDPSDPTKTIGKGSESSVAVIRIISQEEFDRMRRIQDGMKMLMSKYNQARRRLEGLANEIEELKKKIEEQPGDSKMKEENRKALEKLMKRMNQEAKALENLAKNQLPYELDKELSPQLKKQADAIRKLAQQMKALTGNKKTTNKEAAKELQKMLDALNLNRKKLDSDAMKPVENLSKVMPLMKDQARFVQLYKRQRELADRLKSLEGEDAKDDPALKARMRDLEAEQSRLKQELSDLMDDIEDHVEMIPDDPRFDQLKKTALDFVYAVRDSRASAAMNDAVQGLSEFSGTRGHAGAKEAADILESFIGQCNGVGKACRGCLPKFHPSLGNCLNKTMSQMLAEMGLNPGMGKGFNPGMGQGMGFGMGGSGGGYSTRRSTMQNVGLYGDTPMFEQAAASHSGRSSDQSQNAAGRGRNFSKTYNRKSPSFDSRGVLKASGVGEAVVPLRYRRKVGRYFQRIAEEVGNR